MKPIYILFGRDYDWNDEGEQPKCFICACTSPLQAQRFQSEYEEQWDIVDIEEHMLYEDE